MSKSATAKKIGRQRPGRPAGKIVFLCSGEAGAAPASAARVRERVSPPARGRFVVALSVSSAFRGALRRELPRPLGRNRVILDAAPRQGRPGAASLDLARLAERAWFYRRLGATHIVVEAEPPKGRELRSYLVRLIAAFAPVAGEEGLVIDLVLPARAASLLHNDWLLSYLLGEAATRAGRPIEKDLLEIEQVCGEGFALEALPAHSTEETASPRLPALSAAGAPAPHGRGQLGLL